VKTLSLWGFQNIALFVLHPDQLCTATLAQPIGFGEWLFVWPMVGVLGNLFENRWLRI